MQTTNAIEVSVAVAIIPNATLNILFNESSGGETLLTDTVDTASSVLGARFLVPGDPRSIKTDYTTP